MSFFNFLAPLANPSLLLGSLVLVLVQWVLTLPWRFALDPKGVRRAFTTRDGLLSTGGVVLAVTAGLALFLGNNPASSKMIWWGRVYGIVLHLQLLADVFIVGAPWALGKLVPKVGAVAQAAYKECWRQPMFWLILAGGVGATWLAVVIPYFTFGDDYKMMKQIGFDIVMLAPMLFGVLAASIGVSEEIEGRTAITVMSKPINRRSFLLGKFLGVLMACAAMSMLLAANLNGALLANPEFDKINQDRVFEGERAAEAMSLQAKAVTEPAATAAVPGGAGTAEFTRGATRWLTESFTHLFGVLIGFGQVMILVAIATALATRLHFVVTLVCVLAVYLFGHLAPVVSQVTRGGGKGTGAALVGFLAQVFDVVLPALEYFNLGPAVIRDTPLDLGAFAGYSFTVFGYAVIYTAIVLVVGLLLFEDRDLG
jgi:ABC-type transport system involved in multi-copper enzyme maturation permease subunit